MIKSGFRYLKWTAIVAVLALTVMAVVRPSRATKQPPLAAAWNFSAEQTKAILAKYSTIWFLQ